VEKPKILIVEDDKIIAIDIAERLRSFGYESAGIAGNGVKALELVETNSPELILMDINLLGEMDGINLAEKVQELHNIPIIYLTAYADNEMIQRAKQTRPYGYILKPINEKELHSAIEIALYKHKSDKQQKEEGERFKTIVEGYEVSIYIINVEMKIEYVNKYLAGKIGEGTFNAYCYKKIYNSDKMCSWCTFEQVALGNNVRIEIENTQDKRWFYEVATPFYNSEGKINQQRMVFDITEKKAAELKMRELVEEKELMLKEIHHRVKNNLQIMLSLLRLHANKNHKHVSSEDLLRSFESRIRSMALIHDLLYSYNDINRLSFEEYIKRICKNLLLIHEVEPARISIDVEVKDISLCLDNSIPCGLIITELILNSLKHGFTREQNGRIKIQMTHNNGYYKLQVSDDGVGYPDNFNMLNTDNLGIQIIKTLSISLGGTPEFKNENGAVYSIEFKDTDYKNRLVKN